MKPPSELEKVKVVTESPLMPVKFEAIGSLPSDLWNGGHGRW